MIGGNEAIREYGPASTRFFLAVVASAVFVSVLTGSMVNVILPLMRAEFDVSTAQVGWVFTGFALAYAVSVPLYGRISDFFGVRRVFSVGLVGFATGGLICSLAPSLPVLVLGRILQAAGGAAVPALATVAVAKVLPPGKRGGAMGLVASSVGIGAAVGPIIGGVFGQFLGWRALFAGSLVLMLLLIPFARRVLPNGGSTDERQFDLVGGVLLGVGAGLFLFGITQGQGAGFASFSSWGSFLGAALALAGFVRRINGASHPFVSPELFENRPYVAAVLVGFLSMLANLSALVFVPLLLVEVNGLSGSGRTRADARSRRSGHPLARGRTALRPRRREAPRPGGARDHGSLGPVHFDIRRSVARADRRGNPRSGHRLRFHPVPGQQRRRKLAPGRRSRGRDGHLRGGLLPR
jgi:DHA2 family metal-tetracycline-proton antiporter-like MFS transporter/DHA2 family florfenicol/chloramphenicol resistance protein-like MFS transporter